MLMVITRRKPKYTGYGVFEDVGVGNVWLRSGRRRVLLVTPRAKNLHIDSDNEFAMQILLVIGSRIPRYSACGNHVMGSGWYVEPKVRGKDDAGS
jgi:hypothetical protein